MSSICETCGQVVEVAAVAEVMPEGMGVIQPAGYEYPLVYQREGDGYVIRELGGPFLSMTDELLAAINADQGRTS